MSQRNCIRLATRADAATIGQLRVEAFKAAPDFQIANAAFLQQLEWTEEDDAADVVAVFRDGRPIATMRMETVADRDQVTDYAAGLPPPDHTEWPALALARGATHASYAKTGLNSLMRAYFLEAALASGARRFYAYVVFGAARTRLMAALGYEFITRSDADPDLASQRPWALAWLDLHRHGQQARALLEQQVRSIRREYPWVGPPLPVPALRGG
jgi:hypothetical protein